MYCFLSYQFMITIISHHIQKNYNQKLIKVLNFNNKKQFMDQPQVYEKSIRFTDSQNPIQELLMSCIVYSAQYYPLASDFIESIVNKCIGTSDLGLLMSSIQQLIEDINREIIYGPNGCYVTASQRPHKQHVNSCFIRQDSSKDNSTYVRLIKQSVKSHWILQYVPFERIQQILWYRRSNYLKLSKFVNKKVSGSVLKELQVNGQSWIKTTPLPTLLLTLQKVLNHIISSKCQNINPKCYLYVGRLSFLHNKILQNPAKKLSDQALTMYRKYITIINKSKNSEVIAYISLLLEYANVLVFYYKYGQAENIIEFCKQITNLQVEFTGRMGRRTKYQSFDTAQLVMNIKDKSSQSKMIQRQNNDQVDKDAIQIPDAKELVLKQLKNSNINKGVQLDQSKFDEDSILLQKPKYVQQQTKSNDIPLQKILVTLAAIQYMWDTTPKEQILYLQISTSIQTILQYKQKVGLSYPIMFQILLLRSLNQFHRVKNAERALDQMQKLKNNFNEKTQKNIELLYASSYTTYVEFIKILAYKYIQIGMTITAIELFEKVDLIEECIDGLIAKNYKQKALVMARKFQKQNGKTPRLLCMLGDLQEGDKCVSLYQQAWKLSQMRNARSQRSLGWHYYRKKQFLKAAQSFKRATQANFYHPNTWFTLGCCYMQLKEYQKAVPAFGQCVCIDQTQGQAWGNIATCYIYQNRLKEAYSTLQQALKHSQKSWKLWSNMLTVSLKLKKFYKYFECIQRLVQQQKSELITPQMLKKIITIFQYQQINSQRRRNIQAMKNRLDRLYKILVQKIGQNPIVWHSIFQYNQQLQKYTIQNYKHYKKLYEENKIDKNDVLDGYGSMQEMEAYVKDTLAQLRENIVTSKQTQLNMTMKIGWQSNKNISQQVSKVLQQYVFIFEKYGQITQEKQVNQFKLFVNGVRKKIQNCLEKQITIKSTLL